MKRLAGLMVAAMAAGLMITFASATLARGQALAVPRTPEGQPDLTGMWQAMTTAAFDIQDHSAQEGVPAGQGIVVGNTIPYRVDALEQKQLNFENRMTADPMNQCFLPGVPRIMHMPFPFQIVQTPTQVTMLFEYVHAVRNIFANGSSHPEGPIGWWMGDSRGRWEGDTLVVDVTHFNDKT